MGVCFVFLEGRMRSVKLKLGEAQVEVGGFNLGLIFLNKKQSPSPLKIFAFKQDLISMSIEVFDSHSPSYYAICFFTLLIRSIINAVTVIRCRQAGRRAKPVWTGTLLIYGWTGFLPSIPSCVGGVPKSRSFMHLEQIPKNSPEDSLGPEIQQIHQSENTLLVTWGIKLSLKIVISQVPSCFPKC